ncbi:MAG: phosphate ABC transporter permease PstA [Dehalococcoidia bacterium]|nr:phosphate ABC transporter permease PstA [Dehalococcoidia bacterium]
MMFRFKLFLRKLVNLFMLSLCVLGALIAISVVCIMLGYIVVNGVAFLNLDLITNTSVSAGEQGGGMRNEIIGTIILVMLGSILAVPIGILAGVFLSEFGSPRINSAVRFTADILAGVPSIVVGVFVYSIIVRPMHSFSALAASAALAIVMLPVVARTTEESMRLVPDSLREAALALGITRWRAVVSVAIPGALTGIAAGVMLGVARIAGETAPLLYTALGNNYGFEGLTKPIGAMPMQIYRYAISPDANWQNQAWAGAFMLVMMVLFISLGVRWISSKRKTETNN